MGTSGNFSAITSREPFRVCITASGNDKGELEETHFLEVDSSGEIVQGFGRPSAETPLHLALYRLLPEISCVLHTHSIWGVVLSDVFSSEIEIDGYEMLKGLSGVLTHEHLERIPIIENSQDYALLAARMEDALADAGNVHGIYLRRHGLYSWGTDVAEAKRHIEVLEYLFEAVARRSSWPS